MNKKIKLLAGENEIHEEQIWEESQEVYTNMIVYLRVSRLSEYNQELVRRDIIQMLLDGQERGESVKQVIGEDYKEFCDEIIGAFPPKSPKEKACELFDIASMCFCILGGISVIFNIIDNIRQKNHLLTYSLSAADVVNFIVIVIIAYLVVYVICKGAFRKPKKENKAKLFIEGFLALFVITGFFVGANLLLDRYAVRFNMIIAIIGIALVYGVHKIVEATEKA